MTKEVMVTVTGLQTMDGVEQEPIETVHVGEYYERNGTHYVLFDEVLEGVPDPIKNVVKIKNGYLEVQKKGPVTTSMIFKEGHKQESTYTVPYGSFLMETTTHSVQIHHEEDRLSAFAAYEMAVNGAKCADCDIQVHIVSRERFRL